MALMISISSEASSFDGNPACLPPILRCLSDHSRGLDEDAVCQNDSPSSSFGEPDQMRAEHAEHQIQPHAGRRKSNAMIRRVSAEKALADKKAFSIPSPVNSVGSSPSKPEALLSKRGSPSPRNFAQPNNNSNNN
eukprot:CAMPEP_0115158834 /NCGR_PEP_ID=MMETSP0227-20121206/69831_1 /TAXON_ID=89957 /ORGANISM="Polarella glacialis, Strain CCMP 1383" /LENGTH=134 /DNA_ID=CAMNT_0002570387 /DNA_START=52 /DNA_END=453 /DNA_ORIENTATION=-